MKASNDNLNMYQKNLDDDKEIQESFIKADVLDNESESESESEYKIVLPKRSKKHSDTSQNLLHQLIYQNERLSKIQKRMYTIKAELDREEIINRYIKLDLNNSQINLKDMKYDFEVCNKELKYARIENWVSRISMLLYIVYIFFGLF